MLIKNLLVLGLAFVTFAAFSGQESRLATKIPAACSTIFHCVSTKGGSISVCDAGDSLVYSLAHRGGNRTLEIRELRRDIIVERDNGIGRYREFSLGFAKGEEVYTVYYNFDILGPSADPVAGVQLTRGTQLIEEIPCSSKVPVTMKFDSLDLFEEPTTDQE